MSYKNLCIECPTIKMFTNIGPYYKNVQVRIKQYAEWQNRKPMLQAKDRLK